MPSVAVKLYSVLFRFLLKRKLQTLAQSSLPSNSFGVTSRPEEAAAAAIPSFSDGVATKDIHIDPSTSLSLRIFLPDTVLVRVSPNSASVDSSRGLQALNLGILGRDHGMYGGYSPPMENRNLVCRKLPVILQFHGGGFVSGSNDSAANDSFCRRIAKLCDVIVVAVGYRLAPESRYPAAFEDGLKALNWLGKQANLAECNKSIRNVHQYMIDGFGASMVEPWLAAHGDPSRCVLLGVSCGANIADYVARKAVEVGKLLDPVKVVAQVLMYPFFIGSVPMKSEIKLANSYFYDKAMCMLAWKLFLPREDFSLDHPATNPLIPGREPQVPLKCMPPTLTVVAEYDWMRDRAIAYSEELRKANLDAPLLEYKDAVHEFATLDVLLKTPQAQACAEDIAIWVKKYISLRGHEFSY
ncbi:probable carboxylesterase 11 [Malania oleifera]|uniref:probable carboxylesterase 11 n=1 Tax=Malania oleifera TaxID=397392 RepID=UPI0025AE4AE2|nr:probable carboxylesterase 11 [Malania oleifera]